MNKEIKVLDHGVVVLKEIMGTDQTIVDSARVSYQKGTKKVSTDRDLLRYLVRHKHHSPLEMCEMRFYIKAPIFVFRQIVRHRTASMNEISGRYSELSDDLYTPKEFRLQSLSNKQGSGCETLKFNIESYSKAWSEYQALLNKGVAREQARIVIPLATYSEIYWKCDLRNIFNFLLLRLKDNAQQETREYAKAIGSKVKKYFPIAYEAFEDYIFNAVTFSSLEIETIKKYNDEQGLEGFDKENGMTKRERKEFLSKVKKLGAGIGDTVFGE